MSQAGQIFSKLCVAVWLLGAAPAQANTINIDIGDMGSYISGLDPRLPQVFGTIYSSDTIHFYNDVPVGSLSCIFFNHQSAGGSCGGPAGFSESYTDLPAGRYNMSISFIPFKPQHNVFSNVNYFDVLPDPTQSPSPNPVPGPIVGAGIPGAITACGTALIWLRRRRPRTA